MKGQPGETIEKKFSIIIKHLIGSKSNEESLTRIDVSAQFNPEEKTAPAIARNLNAAFLIALSGKTHPRYEPAQKYLKNLQNNPSWREISIFYQNGLKLVQSEIPNACSTDGKFKKNLDQLHSWVINPSNLSNRNETIEKVRQVFFPEGVEICNNKEKKNKCTPGKKKNKYLESKSSSGQKSGKGNLIYLQHSSYHPPSFQKY
ncbi:MAG: hypothetical protein JRJ08_04250 [Deltaproteobacteria bacterium]|nr:hypothetical protein [Deltaproteobacteria bacterium]